MSHNRQTTMGRAWLLVSIGLIVSSIGGAIGSSVPILGVLILGIAPTLLLLGVAGLLTWLIPTRYWPLNIAAVVITTLLLGLNSIGIALLQPLSTPKATFPSSPVRLTPGNWIELETNVAKLYGRTKPLAGPRVSCQYFLCMDFIGIFMPRPGVWGEAWEEEVEGVLLDQGISLSGTGPPAAHLTVSSSETGLRRSLVQIELRDGQGAVLGSLTEEYRTGLPGAPPDDSKINAFEYLRLANPVARSIAALSRNSNPYPLGRFTERSFAVDEPADHVSVIKGLVIETNSPAPAEDLSAATVAGEKQVPQDPLERGCVPDVFERHYADAARVDTDRYWTLSGQDHFPFRFVRGLNGQLLMVAPRYRTPVFNCNNASLFTVLGGSGILRLDRNGTPNLLLPVTLQPPPGEQSFIETASIIENGSALSFTVWYRSAKSDAYTRRQRVTVELEEASSRQHPTP